MTKAEIISALESFKDAVNEERRGKLSEIQGAIEALLDVPILEEAEAIKEQPALEMNPVAESELTEAQAKWKAGAVEVEEPEVQGTVALEDHPSQFVAKNKRVVKKRRPYKRRNK